MDRYDEIVKRRKLTPEERADLKRLMDDMLEEAGAKGIKPADFAAMVGKRLGLPAADIIAAQIRVDGLQIRITKKEPGG